MLLVGQRWDTDQAQAYPLTHGQQQEPAFVVTDTLWSAKVSQHDGEAVH